jgi:hypothetical protein
MSFERFWNENGHGWEHGRAEYNLAQKAWNASRESTIEEAAKTLWKLSENRAACVPHAIKAIESLARPVPPQEEK